VKLKNTGASIYIPDLRGFDVAAKRTRRLGVGAHQDDLEFMCFSAIWQSHEERSFSGIIVTDGRGSARTGDFAHVSDEAMIEIREEEQREAARLGNYSLIAQLRYPSSCVKRALNPNLVDELYSLFLALEAEEIYTHSPFDKLLSHIGVFAAVIAALRKLPEAKRPQRVLGCEVWRDLDWIHDDDKVLLNVSQGFELMQKLMNVFASQIEGGKSYAAAIEGRKRANARFQDAHSVDQASLLEVAIDLTPLLKNSKMTLAHFAELHLERFRKDVLHNLSLMDLMK
jgi:LmbE family N-acetylglucosaminyl deacetylase